MTAKTLAALWPLIEPAVESLVTLFIGWATLHIVAYCTLHKRLAALAFVATSFQKALDAAVSAAGAAGPPSPVTAAVAWRAAKASILFQMPDIEKALGMELDDLLNQHATAATGSTAAAPTAVAPGGGVVNLPSPLKSLAFTVALTGALLGAPRAFADTSLTAAPPNTATLTLPTIDWKTVSLEHGPSVQAFALSPSSLHPVELPAGFGYGVGAGFGQMTLNGAKVSLLDVSLQVYLSIVAPPPGQAPSGGVQFAPCLGFLSNAIGAGPLFTAYDAATGFFNDPVQIFVFGDPISIWHLLGGT